MDVSVIVSTYNASQTIEECLKGLAEQKTQYTYEVIVVDSSTDPTPGLIEKKFPWVRLIHFEERLYCGGARNVGIKTAYGRLIALTDGDCIVSSDWVDRLVRAHDSPHPVIGGSIVCDESDSSTQLAYFFCELSQWLPKGPPRRLYDQPGANVCYKRDIFNQLGGFLNEGYCSDTDFHHRLRLSGQSIWFEPLIQVRHLSPNRLGPVLRHHFQHGRFFGKWRMAQKGWTPLKRIVFITLWPAVYIKICLSKARYALSLPKFRKLLLKCLPQFMIGVACWGLGEAWAYFKIQEQNTTISKRWPGF